ncbi:hypothetical protein BDQ17DRAFT_1352667 [Cyathus striatus]|nr:hypothetical protein BDQ17DRAFT_1352667 [Cyathus striatus]
MPYHPSLVENTGSNARDFAMLERNILSHLKLALLLSLLSSSVLLQARLVPNEPTHTSSGRIPLATVEFSAALVCIIAGAWEYYSGYWDLRKTRAFLASPKPHLLMMGAVVAIVFATCIVLLVQD